MGTINVYGLFDRALERLVREARVQRPCLDDQGEELIETKEECYGRD